MDGIKLRNLGPYLPLSELWSPHYNGSWIKANQMDLASNLFQLSICPFTGLIREKENG